MWFSTFNFEVLRGGDGDTGVNVAAFAADSAVVVHVLPTVGDDNDDDDVGGGGSGDEQAAGDRWLGGLSVLMQ